MLFDEGSAIIKKDALKTVDEIIDTISKVDNNVMVEGHTDSTPISNEKYPSNSENLCYFWLPNSIKADWRLCYAYQM